ncbi:3-oxoacyl-[acyl-carrier-protein] synthase III C-terminal domain-containing protein [Micromonospora yangpuensis]|uniref:3-oxoacyl-[acyl-carrier-protein] synthase-3 n=1 Tax=Micromonospora yangpuensis TaxID=683228 RepID=A0A1C6VA36_9ACTN|nr:3-oxoacyl-[acyl-carrier-protein] synthase III C-terminal domain-containing protein [Micromonospora yangpuensis]GGM22546.1 hypothetical protein GCM10012279_46110 [Micromonospora yangpuensis]SCL63146.1 3-oxoacyl-[acyl-carrier-protein] synthase-3 [Micromonospora yangpuensis]
MDGMTLQVHITGCASYLPGEPVGNDELVGLLGDDGSSAAAAVRRRVLAANGIRSRHYALDAAGRTTMLNEELAAEAVLRAVKSSGRDVRELGLLATGTTQGDVLVPGFASMVHGRLDAGPLETLSAAGVCASSMAAFRSAVASVRLGEHDLAAVVGSELISRALKQSRYAAGASGQRVGYDAQFLRWTLSDGAGAVILEPGPRPDRPSLRVDWTHLVSHAHEHATCMRAGLADRPGGQPAAGDTWLDRATAAEAEQAGLLRLRQDVRALPDLFTAGVGEYVRLVRAGRFDPREVDHVLCHYSSEHFRADIFRLLREADLMIDEKRWFSNLSTRGNTGAASIFVMLDEAWQSGRFAPGDRILLVVPESGRFSFAFAHLTCVGPADRPTPTSRSGRTGQTVSGATVSGATVDRPVATGQTVGQTGTVEAGAVESPLGSPRADDDEVVRWTVLELAGVWADLESRLRRVPVLRRLDTGTATLADYRRLLLTLRPQVVEGGRWISRAASNFSEELFELRSAAMHHALEEHRDFRLLEEDFQSVGGDLTEIRTASKNVGSEALSAFMFHQASQPDPVDLLGAMFVIEGLGTAKAARWAGQLREQLGLAEEQLRFLLYHGANDDDHFAALRDVLRSGLIDRPRAERIVRTARVVARLYALQLEEIDD